MAETVQYFMERMVPDLEELERKGYFTNTEINSIIKKRTNFEYAMNRRIKKKIDFLRSIEYEMNLEQLRVKRKARMATSEKAGMAEYSIHKRIFQLFKRALVRFHGDVSLWMQYIDFAKKSQSQKLLSSIFVQALQYHPNHSPLWIMAASWEFEDNANMGAARLLLQRALRMNPQSPELWHEYFRLELLYIEKIKVRRRILGIDEQSLKQKELEKEQQQLDDGNDDVIQLPEMTGEDMDQDDEASASVKKLQESTANALNEGINPILQGLLAKIIYNNAIDVISNDLTFRCDFVDIYRQFSDHDNGCNEIFESIERDMSTDPLARSYLATRHLFTKPSNAIQDEATAKYIPVSDPAFVVALKRTVDDFQSSLDQVPTSAMWQQYVDFLVEWAALVTDEHLTLYLDKLLHRAFQNCAKKQLLSPELYVTWIEWLRNDKTNDSTKLDKARAKANDATTTYPEQNRLWSLRLDLLPTDTEADDALALYKKALQQCPHSVDLWSAYMDWILAQWDLCNSSKPSDEDWSLDRIDALLRDACQTVTALLPSLVAETDERNQIKNLVLSCYVTWAKQAKGMPGFRTTYQYIIQHLYPTFAFYKTCLEIENNQEQDLLAAHQKPDLASEKSVEHLFELAARLDNVKQQVYLMYLSYLYTHKKFQKANLVYFKACKEVPDKDVFEQQFQAVKQGKQHFTS
ncbi:hypothetical protein DM01DRAFT_1404333 [Hesseltinella vesiculosa]|uniref:U3 small nucleolar RNA-associated protein 6 n=1 Tax=Hesseltinella vesiculosa TaxID=101127 RepID=A0A1X2GU45_9FUNG|nr:hypothetical protein DM01DRAFT_1404333 [Hesseltinella vesiculosa]